MKHGNDDMTPSHTNIEEVKRKNAESGLSYNEVLEILTQTGGHGTAVYSNTDAEEVRKDIHSQND